MYLEFNHIDKLGVNTEHPCVGHFLGVTQPINLSLFADSIVNNDCTPRPSPRLGRGSRKFPHYLRVVNLPVVRRQSDSALHILRNNNSRHEDDERDKREDD